jgi:hypothetical protein
MPLHVVNEKMYADRTVQDWHRERFGPEAWAIDFDLVGVCRGCKEAVYLIESTSNPQKPTSIIRTHAIRADVPAFIVWHAGGVVTSGRQIYPRFRDYSSEHDIAAALDGARRWHKCGHRPRLQGVQHESPADE